MKNIGVVGLGIVGNAFYEGMKHACHILRFDKFNQQRSDVPQINDLCKLVDGPIFICVPTPMNPDGSCNIDIVKEVIAQIQAIDQGHNHSRVIVVKSTVPPGTCEHFNNVVFNPEFLTEATPIEDFKNQDRIVLGGKSEHTQEIADLYAAAYPNVTIVQCAITVAEMVKYVANCFLATKVSFANEIYQICEKLNIDYNSVIRTATLDKRLGMSHWKVPGPMPASDGTGKLLYGFGGSCFVKDINALIKTTEDLGIDAKMLRAAWEKNLEVRPEKDWENLKGRAIL